MKKVVFSIILTLFATKMGAQESQTGYNFLRLPVSAHAAALGGDNITLIEDDAALAFHNPALLVSVNDRTLNFNYMNYMKGVNMASQYVDYGKMKQTDENNIQMGEFSAKDICLAGTFSYLLSERLVGGITAKFITSYIGDYNSIAMGVDLGLNYYDSEKEWSVSAVAKNLGGQLKAYDEEYEKMPIDLQVGVSKHFINTPFRVSATLVNLNHWDKGIRNHAVLGADLLLSESLWVGAGYNFRRHDEMKIVNGEDETSSHGAGWSLGGGINLERFHLNIAYGKYHVNSNSLLLNIDYRL